MPVVWCGTALLEQTFCDSAELSFARVPEDFSGGSAQSGPVVTCDLFSDAPAGCCMSIASSGGADFRPVWLGLARLISGLGV